MDDLRELYQSTILDHNKSPRNFRVPDDHNRQADGYNPICGDKLTLYLVVDDAGTVVDAGFQGSGCAISTASASLMTEYVKGRPQAEIEETFGIFHDLLTGSPSNHEAAPELGKLAVFAGVREYPMRVKCATLAWHTLNAALAGDESPAKTE
jgi:nitrogen fixation NifU-like protein